MQRLKNLSMILSGVVMSGLLLSGGLVFAGDSTNSTNQGSTTKPAITERGMGDRGGMRGGHRGGHRGGPGFGGAGMLSQDNLDKLVKAEVITQVKATEIKTYMDKQETQRKADFEAMQKLTAEERKAQFEQKSAAKKTTTPGEKHGMFSDLVTNKILTQEQADTIQTKLAEFAQQEQEQKFADSLKTLVDKGTITQAQADQITSKMEAMQKEQQTLRDKLKDMTADERKAYLDKNEVKPILALFHDSF